MFLVSFDYERLFENLQKCKNTYRVRSITLLISTFKVKIQWNHCLRNLCVYKYKCTKSNEID